MSNPNIAEAGKNTQFKEGNKGGGRHPGESLTTILRRLSESESDITIDELVEGVLTTRKLTNAEATALKAWQQANEGDMRAIEYVTDRLDGKVVQPIAMSDNRLVVFGKEDDPDVAQLPEHDPEVQTE